MVTLADIHRQLYTWAAELRDGPDARHAERLRSIADDLGTELPNAPEAVEGTPTSMPAAPNTSLGESDVRRAVPVRTAASGYAETAQPTEPVSVQSTADTTVAPAQTTADTSPVGPGDASLNADQQANDTVTANSSADTPALASQPQSDPNAGTTPMVVPESTGDATAPESRVISRTGDAGNTSTER